MTSGAGEFIPPQPRPGRGTLARRRRAEAEKLAVALSTEVPRAGSTGLRASAPLNTLERTARAYVHSRQGAAERRQTLTSCGTWRRASPGADRGQ